MADTDSRDHDQLETAASTPSSQHASQNGSVLKSSKDRNCPFCGQAFTSSSLGRHLDLYIKPKNAKPPDGVHHVDEIRKMRGGITRRQPKANLKPGANVNASGWRRGSSGGDGDGDDYDGTPTSAMGGVDSGGHRVASCASAAPKVDTNARLTEESPTVSPVNNLREHKMVQTSFNVANWQATGVINNLPPRAPSREKNNAAPPTPAGQVQRMQDMRRDNAGRRTQRPDFRQNESMAKMQEDAEVGRAAELALREVLGSLEAAKKKVEPKQLFEDVAFFSLSFPGLCLAILPAPTTLFSPTPFPSVESWTLAPPDHQQWEALNRFTNQRMLSLQQGPGGRDSFPDSVAFKHHAHMQGAYEHWNCLTDSDRESAWRLETLRAYSRASDERHQAKDELGAAQNRISHLEAEYDRLSRCQLPREYLLHPPNTIPAPAAIVKELQSTRFKSGATADLDYDVDALLSKWRTAVKATTRGRPPPPPHPPPAAAARRDEPMYDATASNQLEEDIILNGAVFAVNGAMRRPSAARNVRYLDPDHGQAEYVDYETPPQPGAVVGATDDEGVDGEVNGVVDEDGENEVELDAEGEAESDNDDDDSGNFGGFVDGASSALVRQTRSGNQRGRVNMHVGTRGLNGNGKRPLAPTPTSGRSGGAKIYRERWGERRSANV